MMGLVSMVTVNMYLSRIAITVSQAVVYHYMCIFVSIMVNFKYIYISSSRFNSRIPIRTLAALIKSTIQGGLVLVLKYTIIYIATAQTSKNN